MESDLSTLLPYVPGQQTFTHVRDESETNCQLQSFNTENIFDIRTNAAEASTNISLIPLAVVQAGQRLESYTQEVWESHKLQIHQLYIKEGKKLLEVMHQMRMEKGFSPS